MSAETVTVEFDRAAFVEAANKVIRMFLPGFEADGGLSEHDGSPVFPDSDGNLTAMVNLYLVKDGAIIIDPDTPHTHVFYCWNVHAQPTPPPDVLGHALAGGLVIANTFDEAAQERKEAP